MKTRDLWMALVALMMCFVCNEAYAYDIAVVNADGKTIYYNFINNDNELEVTNGSSYYTGIINIPQSVTYMDQTRSVTSIGGSAFYNCIGLNSVTIPNSVTTL